MIERSIAMAALVGVLAGGCQTTVVPSPATAIPSPSSTASKPSTQASTSPSPVAGGCGGTQVFAGPGPDAALGLWGNPWAQATPSDAGLLAYFWSPLPSPMAAAIRARVTSDIGRYFTARLQARYLWGILAAVDQIGTSEWNVQGDLRFDWGDATVDGDRATVHVAEIGWGVARRPVWHRSDRVPSLRMDGGLDGQPGSVRGRVARRRARCSMPGRVRVTAGSGDISGR